MRKRYLQLCKTMSHTEGMKGMPAILVTANHTGRPLLTTVLPNFNFILVHEVEPQKIFKKMFINYHTSAFYI
jgi:hypothetical protein